MGFERSEQNNPVSCFVNGDRRILQSITLNPIRNALQNSRTNPSVSAKKQEASWVEGASCFLREYKWDSDTVKTRNRKGADSLESAPIFTQEI